MAVDKVIAVVVHGLAAWLPLAMGKRLTPGVPGTETVKDEGEEGSREDNKGDQKGTTRETESDTKVESSEINGKEVPPEGVILLYLKNSLADLPNDNGCRF